MLLKEADARRLTFYTNLRSAKARELAGRPYAAVVLWWPELHRQVRVEGRVQLVPAAESDAYFATRPRGAQLGAWASQQSRVVASRASASLRSTIRARGLPRVSIVASVMAFGSRKP